MNRDMREIIRDEPFIRRELLGLLAPDGRSVPEIAAALGRPAGEVMTWVMSLRKYGYVTEERAGDGSYRYRAVRQP